MSTTLISASALQKHFGKVKAIDGIDVRVDSGEIYGLVGADGAGKTTLLRLLCGVLHPDNGKVTLCGIDMAKDPEQARQKVGYLAQRFALYEDLTVMENLRFFAEVRGLSPADWKSRCLEILAFVGLSEFTERIAGHLSGGMKQKLGLAAALVHRPQLILLDEPTTGVDPVTRQDFWQLIIRLVTQEEVAVVVSTPYMDEASRCMRLAFISNGRILVEGTPKSLRSILEGRILELNGQPIALLRKIAQNTENVENAQMFGGRLHLRVKEGKSNEVITALEKSIPNSGGTISGLHAISPQLEDVFIALS